MHTAPVPSDRRTADLTARAQIRDAAIECFAQSGFRASFRDIASRAGVSPALITHHFSSKANLRRECDAEVLRRYRSTKIGAIGLLPGGFSRLAATVTHDEAVMSVYVLRAVSAGGRAAGVFLDQFTEQVAAVLADYESAGLIRPSRDEVSRARFHAREMLGTILVHFLTTSWTTPEDFLAGLFDRSGDLVLPLLELYSEGFLTSSDMLEQYLQGSGDPSDAPSQSGS